MVGEYTHQTGPLAKKSGHTRLPWFGQCFLTPRPLVLNIFRMAVQAIGDARPKAFPYYVFLAFLAFCMTACTIQRSMRCGRLAIPPQFDDVGYMHEAASRIDTLWRHGTIAVIKQYFANPPHSPWSTALGMIGFGIFGIRDWAVFAMNGVIVLAYLIFADYLLGHARLWQKLICFAFLLAMPIIPESVAEFQPDHACALFTVIACMLLVEKSLWSIYADQADHISRHHHSHDRLSHHEHGGRSARRSDAA
jgi:hypothetical protein